MVPHTRRLFLTLLPAMLLAGCSPAPEFREYTSRPGAYSVLMPGIPQERTEESLAGPMTTATVPRWGVHYQVAYLDLPLPPDASPAALEERLDGIQNGAVHNIQGTVVRAGPITLQAKYPGRDLVAELPQGSGVIHLRLFLAHGRLYQVSVRGKRAYVEAPEAERFLGSFRLIPTEPAG